MVREYVGASQAGRMTRVLAVRQAEPGLEQVVEDPAAVRLRVVDQQSAVAAAADRADTIEGTPAAATPPPKQPAWICAG
ncbi:hypothetical protein GCM10010193_16610 [Kitasatospora atroaurantiaca]